MKKERKTHYKLSPHVLQVCFWFIIRFISSVFMLFMCHTHDSWLLELRFSVTFPAALTLILRHLYEAEQMQEMKQPVWRPRNLYTLNRLQPCICKTSKQAFIFHSLSCNNNFMAVGCFHIYAACFLFFMYDVIQVHSGNKHSTSNWIKKIRGQYYWQVKSILIMTLNNLVNVF